MRINDTRAIVVLPRGYRLYKQSHTPTTLTSLSKAPHPFVWFAFEAGYGKNYGRHQLVFECKRKIRLLNVGHTYIRKAMSVLLDIPFSKLNCNEQYSGGSGNKAFHEAIKPFLRGMRFDGTIIHDSSVDNECEGANEVVLLRERVVPSLRRPAAQTKEVKEKRAKRTSSCHAPVS